MVRFGLLALNGPIGRERKPLAMFSQIGVRQSVKRWLGAVSRGLTITIYLESEPVLPLPPFQQQLT